MCGSGWRAVDELAQPRECIREPWRWPIQVRLVLEGHVSVHSLAVDPFNVVEGGVIEAVGRAPASRSRCSAAPSSMSVRTWAIVGSMVIGCQFCSGVAIMALQHGAPGARGGDRWGVLRAIRCGWPLLGFVVPRQRDE